MGTWDEWLCRHGLHKWRRRMAEQDPQFIEDGLALGLPAGVAWVNFCARGCGAGGRVES